MDYWKQDLKRQLRQLDNPQLRGVCCCRDGSNPEEYSLKNLLAVDSVAQFVAVQAQRGGELLMTFSMQCFVAMVRMIKLGADGFYRFDLDCLREEK